jgi:hypothetical protein
MTSRWIFTSLGLSRDAIQLGSLVPDIRYPQQDALIAISADDSEYHVHIQQNFKGLLNESKDSIFKACLARLISVSYEAGKESNIELSSHEGRVYELKNPESLFKRLCSLKNVRGLMQDRIEAGRNIYFIVGFRTFFDASIQKHPKDSSQISGHAQIPVGDIASDAAIAVGDHLDVGVTGTPHRSRANTEALHAPGEQIYAFCYRKVAFKWFDHRGPDSAILKAGNSWVMTSGNRDNNDENSEGVEASLEELDEGELGKSNYYKTEDGKEEFIFLQV